MKDYKKPILTIDEFTDFDIITSSISIDVDETDHVDDPYGSGWFN